MTYIDFNYLTNVYPKIGSIGGSDEITIFIESSDSMINGYLSSFYSVPFSPAPPLIKMLSAKLTYAELALDKDKSRDAIRSEAITTLEKLANGEIALTTGSGTLVSRTEGSSIWCETEDYMPTFNVDDPTMWQQDSSQLYNLEVDRDG